MKKYLLIYLFIITPISVEAQYSIRASMGIEFANTPSLNDYINQTFRGIDPVDDFNTAINFSGEFGYSVTNSFQAGLEIGYLLNSYNYLSDLGKYELDYDIIAPSLLVYYVLNGDGYNFKFGGGFGLRFVNVDLSLPPTTGISNYSHTGFGFILRVEGNTLLGGNFYANIGGDLKYDVNGNPKSGNINLDKKFNGVNINSLAVGLRLGVSYIL